jgi:hypothetical protein
LVAGPRSWKLVLAMGLLVTLLNDLTYAPMGNLLFNQGRDLLSWYSNQLDLAAWAQERIKRLTRPKKLLEVLGT